MTRRLNARAVVIASFKKKGKNTCAKLLLFFAAVNAQKFARHFLVELRHRPFSFKSVQDSEELSFGSPLFQSASGRRLSRSRRIFESSDELYQTRLFVFGEGGKS